jgi:hypothetical protein
MKMQTRTIAAICVLAFSQAAFANEGLPPRMQGGFRTSATLRTGGVIVELLAAETEDRARIRVTLLNTTDAHGNACGFKPQETIAQRKEGAWQFGFPSPYCSRSNWVMTIRPFEGKNRFEGKFTTDFPNDGTVSLEW